MNNRGKIEYLLSKLEEQLVTLSMHDDKLSKNEAHLLHTIRRNQPEIRNHLRMVYQDNIVEEKEARSFHALLKAVLEEAFKIARLDQVIERDENELLDHLYNTFVDITRLIKADIDG